MWHKAKWMGRPMRLELTRVGLLVYLANRYTTRGALFLRNNYHLFACSYVVSRIILYQKFSSLCAPLWLILMAYQLIEDYSKPRG